MNISEQPLDPRYLRKHPKSYTEEPMGKIEFDDPTFRKSVDTLHDEGMKLGGRSVLNARVKELIRENEELKKMYSDLIMQNARLIDVKVSLMIEIDDLKKHLEGMTWVADSNNEAYQTERKRSARWKAKAKQQHGALSAFCDFAVGIGDTIVKAYTGDKK
jgi:regulator of replication initiation timing